MINQTPHYSLKANNTFRIDQSCRLFVEYDSVADLKQIIRSGMLVEQQYMSIGQGSNILLIADYDGIVLHSRILDIEETEATDGDVILTAGAGVIMDDLIVYAVSKGLYGLENLSLIPGTVGASVVQNVGAYGVEAKDCAVEVEMIDVETGDIRIASNAECEFDYRMSRFKKDWAGRYIVTHVSYKLSRNPSYKLDYGGLRKMLPEGELSLPLLRDTIIDIRNAKLPKVSEYGSAGSFFKNPIVSKKEYERITAIYKETNEDDVPKYDLPDDMVKIPAGWLIDKCNWRGKSRGDAGVWSKQALILVNLGKAKGYEIEALAKEIQADVANRFGVELHPEVIFVK